MSSTAEEEVLAAEDERNRATVAGDHVTLDRLTADEYIHARGNGEVMDKTAYLNGYRQKTRSWRRLDYDERNVRLIAPDVAVVHGRTTIDRTNGNDVYSGPSSFTHVWVRRNGQWQIISAHYTHGGR